MKSKLFPLLIIIGILFNCEVFSQTGSLKGKIVDSKTNEPLIGASVSVSDGTIGAIADLNGDFLIKNIPSGKYSFRAGFVSYNPIFVEIEIKDKVTTEHDFQLISMEVELEAVSVVAKVNRENENVLLVEQKKSMLQIQSIGAKELSRKGVSDAEAAVTKISGISKQEGVKNVFVRGLGDRYNLTTLNDFPIPSEDPEYKNISLDFFTTDVIQFVEVNKVFSASHFSDVGGAIIDISSKELSTDLELKVSASAGVNSQTIGKNLLKMDGVNLFGFANTQQPSSLDVYNYDNSLDPKEINNPINSSIGISGGKKFLIGQKQNPLNVFFSINNSNDYSYTTDYNNNSTTTGNIIQELVGSKSSQHTSQLGLANISYSTKSNNTLSYNFMYVHTNNQYVGDYVGLFQRIDDAEGYFRRQQTNDNRLYINQLNSSWNLNNKLVLNLGASYNYILGLEPDRRINGFKEVGNDTYVLLLDKNNIRYYSTLKENDFNVKASLVYKIKDSYNNLSNIKIGYNARIVNDIFEAVEYNNAPVPGMSPIFNINDFKLDDFYNQLNFSDGLFLNQKSSKEYTVDKYLHSTYAEATIQPTRRLVLNGGLKLDIVNLAIIYDLSGVGNDVKPDEINKIFLLPSFNAKYSISERQSLRLGLSKTYTLPQAKEISPFKYINMNFESMGYDKLKPSENYNADLKWEFFPTSNELISFTVFYKHITLPISRISVGSAAGLLSYRNIAKFATVGGAEFELRKNIFSFSNGNRVNRLSLGLNASYIYTNAKISRDYDVPNPTVTTGSQLEGAAPFIANIDLSHQIFTNKGNFINTLVFGYFSDRVYTIGTEGYKDIIEKGLPTLDYVSSIGLTKKISVDLKIRNILNPSFQLVRNANITNHEVLLTSYKKGISYNLGVTFSL